MDGICHIRRSETAEKTCLKLGRTSIGLLQQPDPSADLLENPVLVSVFQVARFVEDPLNHPWKELSVHKIEECVANMSGSRFVAPLIDQRNEEL